MRLTLALAYAYSITPEAGFYSPVGVTGSLTEITLARLYASLRCTIVPRHISSFC